MTQPGQLDMFGQEQTGSEEYQQFVKKFTEHPKTTDDCYTPENVYNAVAQWVAGEYCVQREAMVRPFWPGGDYKTFDYPEGCVVVDNPPFSILSEILRYYVASGISFFLFAPTLTLFSPRVQGLTFIPCGVQITYENKAEVNTSFITNLDTCQVRSAPSLYSALKLANDSNVVTHKIPHPKYLYPEHVLMASAVSHYSRYGIDYRLGFHDCTRISALDEQKAHKKTLFGSGFLLSEHAAAIHAEADRAVAEREAAERVFLWALSEREKAIVKSLGTTCNHADIKGGKFEL